MCRSDTFSSLTNRKEDIRVRIFRSSNNGHQGSISMKHCQILIPQVQYKSLYYLYKKASFEFNCKGLGLLLFTFPDHGKT